MHPALRKGPLFTNTPPFSTLLQKTPPPFHFLPKGLRSLSIEQLLHPVGRLEVFRDGVVHPRNHLVDRLLPRLLHVLVGRQRYVELTQCRLYHEPEVLRHLTKQRHRRQFQ